MLMPSRGGDCAEGGEGVAQDDFLCKAPFCQSVSVILRMDFMVDLGHDGAPLSAVFEISMKPGLLILFCHETRHDFSKGPALDTFTVGRFDSVVLSSDNSCRIFTD